MKSLLIVGAGEYGQLVKELAEICRYDKIGFLDDNSSEAVGKVSDYKKLVNEYHFFIVSIGNPEIRSRIIQELENEFELISLVHPTAVISSSANVEHGCVIEAHVVINANASVGTGCILNAGSVINHNGVVGAYSQVDCNAVVAARKMVPEKTKVLSCTVWNES